MLRRLALLPVLLLAACATAEDDLGIAFDGAPLDARTDTGSGDDTRTTEDTGSTPPPDTTVADTTPTDAAGCTGVIANWNWNAGTGPTTLVKSSTTSLWAIGAATSYGPKDGATYLATNPNVGSYVDGMREWVRLPTIPLGAYAACKIKISVEVWRYCEGLSTTVDGGNLQFTAAADAASATDWKAVDGTSMGYDGVTTASACSSTCFVYNQKLWAGRAAPYAKSGTFTSTAPMGSQLTFRFTFFSDASLASYDGLYVKSLKVEAVP